MQYLQYIWASQVEEILWTLTLRFTVFVIIWNFGSGTSELQKITKLSIIGHFDDFQEIWAWPTRTQILKYIFLNILSYILDLYRV